MRVGSVCDALLGPGADGCSVLKTDHGGQTSDTLCLHLWYTLPTLVVHLSDLHSRDELSG